MAHDEEGLELFASMPPPNQMLGDHDLEECGMCFERNLRIVVAREILDEIRKGENAGKPGAFDGALKRWEAEVEKRWLESKYVKLWVAEKAAGRDPHIAFAERGWEM